MDSGDSLPAGKDDPRASGLETALNELVSRHFITAVWGEPLELHEHLDHDLSHNWLVKFYILNSGFCELIDLKSDPRVMETGDLLLVFGCAGLDAARLRAPCPPQQSSGMAKLLRGGFNLSGNRSWPLSRLLPTLLHLKAAEHAWLRPIGNALFDLARLGAAGRPLVLRLLEGVLIQALLCGLSANPRQGIGKALRDRSVCAALQRIHRAPEEHWSVERLADEVGASRSAFARRFTEAIGYSPMRYLTRVRMEIAAQAMRTEPDTTLAQLAASLGYSSEFSLSKAFRRHFGHAPSAHTRSHGGRAST